MKNNFIFNQKISFYAISFIKLWERFGYYGLQSILLIYLVRHLKLTEFDAINIFSSFIALIYSFVSIGGWIGDKILGTKKSIMLGIIILMIGYFIITIYNNNINLIYLGMSFIIIGNGIFKANPSSLITHIYKNNKFNLDNAFTIYYMAINIGSFLSIIFFPWIVIKFNWNIAFLISTLGLFISLINFIIFYNYFKIFGSKIDFEKISIKKYLSVLFIIIISLLLSFLLIKNNNLIKFLLLIIFLLILIKLFKEIIYSSKNERKLLLISYIMIFESILFFILYGQMPTSLNFFAIHHVNNKMLGIKFFPEQYQALNPMFIILLSPLLAIFYNFNIIKKINITYKFSFGMLLCSLSFLILSIGCVFYNKNGIISSYWLLFSYLFQSLGELMISGLGLSMISKFVPLRLMGFMMGVWYLTSSFSAIISGHLANIISNNKINTLSKINSLFKYSNFFLKIGIFSFLISIIMFIISYKIEKYFNK